MMLFNHGVCTFLCMVIATLISGVKGDIINDPASIGEQVFDYIVVGGGTTGLTVAARLSEDPHIRVLIIESGFWEGDRGPEVHNLTYYGRQFGTAMDHVYTTRPQSVDNRAHHINSGRGLGGSTLINGGAWTRPAKVQIDSWQSVFGNDGWTWDELLPHMKRVENVRPPSLKAGPKQPFDQRCHGDIGAVQIGSFDTGAEYSPIIQAFQDMAQQNDIPVDNDLSCGTPRGVSTFPVTVSSNGHRSDAGRAWLLPIMERSNVKVLVGESVGKVLFDRSLGTPRAVGIQYGRYRGQTGEIYATEEVILATGAISSPLILESSGVGLSHILANAGVDQVVELPVGVNHQDQANTNVVNQLSAEGHGQGQVAYFASFNETLGNMASKGYRKLQDDVYLQEVADAVVASGGFHDASLLMTQYRNYRNHIEHHDIAFSELLLDTWGEFGFSVWNLLPLGRGFVHIQSSDPYLRDYDYDPQLLSTELDILAQATASKLARSLSNTSHLAKFRTREQNPGLDEVPDSDGDNDIDAWARWVKSNYRPNLHAVGTCSMMRRDLGGVVNNRAQVYGVEGLRVVDASILPTQVSSHMMALLYGVADKIAGYIQEDYAKKTISDEAKSGAHEEL